MSIILTESNSEIAAKINKALAIQMNSVLKNNKSQIENKAKSLASGWILSQPEILSLQSGDPNSLAGLFGVRAGSVPGVVSSIVQSIQNSIYVSFMPFDKDLKGNLEIRFQPSGFENLLSLGAGHVFYEGGDLHWLNWLLTMGSSIIISGYRYQANPGTGRSGLGTMTIGSSFRVPPKFSGTVADNFVTRALIGKGQEQAIMNIIKGVLQ
jgi:hypothetical protein